MDMQVSFLIAGTQKGGTKALKYFLRRHPNICMPRAEVHYFDRDRLFRGKPDYWFYHAHFKGKKEPFIFGEGTPRYMYYPPATKRVFNYNRNMKWIMSLRNPITRAYAHWNMVKVKDSKIKPFMEAITDSKEEHMYLDRGFYSKQIKRIWELFPKKQTLIFKQSALFESPQKVVNMICDFLGIARLKGISRKIIHQGSYNRPLKIDERQYLKQIYEKEVKQLERLLNWDCSDWLSNDGGPY